jgi:hypothetical protein
MDCTYGQIGNANRKLELSPAFAHFFMRDIFREENIMKLSGHAKDITGLRFGRLLAVSPIGISEKKGNREVVWECLCDCGKKISVIGSPLRSGHTKSCGCLHIEAARELGLMSKTHGKRRTKEYHIWSNVIQRCENKNSGSYHKYGGKGIYICQRWRTSFDNFLKDMGNIPGDKTSIDRIDNKKGYEPGNCRWADWTEQARNKDLSRLNNTGTIGVGFRRDCGKYQARITVNGKRISLGMFMDIDDAAIVRKEAELKHWGKCRAAEGKAYQD